MSFFKGSYNNEVSFYFPRSTCPCTCMQQNGNDFYDAMALNGLFADLYIVCPQLSFATGLYLSLPNSSFCHMFVRGFYDTHRISDHNNVKFLLSWIHSGPGLLSSKGD